MSDIYKNLDNDIKEIIIKHLTDNTRNHKILMFELKRFGNIMLKARERHLNKWETAGYRENYKWVEYYTFIQFWVKHCTQLFDRYRIHMRWLLVDSDDDSDDSDGDQLHHVGPAYFNGEF